MMKINIKLRSEVKYTQNNILNRTFSTINGTKFKYIESSEDLYRFKYVLLESNGKTGWDLWAQIEAQLEVGLVYEVK